MRGCSGDVRGCSWGGTCMVAPGGACVVAPRGGMHGCSRGACVVAWGGVCGCFGGHTWLLQGGVVAPGGACVVAPGGGACVVALGGVRGFFDEIRSMSGRYASYWNAFLLNFYYHQNNGKKTGLSPILSVIHTVIIGTMLNYTDGKKRTPTKSVTCKQTFIDYVRISVSLLSQ